MYSGVPSKSSAAVVVVVVMVADSSIVGGYNDELAPAVSVRWKV